MNSGKNKNTADRTRPTRQEKRAAKREAKMRRKEALRNAPLSVRIRNGALNVITVCLIGIILVSGYKIGKTMWEYQVAKSAYTNISEKTAKVDPKQFTGVVDWKALKKVNPDVQGWLYQKGTVPSNLIPALGDHQGALALTVGVLAALFRAKTTGMG